MSFSRKAECDSKKNNNDSMRKQVYSLPGMLEEIYADYVGKVESLLSRVDIKSIERIYIFGCGDSCFVGQVVKYLFEKESRLPVEVYTSLEFSRYVVDLLPDSNNSKALAIGISVSGSVSRTREALKKAKEKRILTLAVSAKESAFTDMADDFVIANSPLFNDEEPNGTPGVRSFFCNYMMLAIIALTAARVRSYLTVEKCQQKLEQYKELSVAIKGVIESTEEELNLLASAWHDTYEYVFVGSGPNFGAAQFCAAKLIEATGDFSLAQETEEWAHLNFYNRKSDTPTVILSSGKNDLSRTMEVVSAALNIGRRAILIAPDSVSIDMEACSVLAYPDGYDEWISAIFPCLLFSLYASSRAVLLNETYFRVNNSLEVSKIRTSETVE